MSSFLYWEPLCIYKYPAIQLALSSKCQYIPLESPSWQVWKIMMKRNTNKIKVKDSDWQVWDNMGMCMFLFWGHDSLISTICCLSKTLKRKRGSEALRSDTHFVSLQGNTGGRMVGLWLTSPKSFILLWALFRLAWYGKYLYSKKKNVTIFVKAWLDLLAYRNILGTFIFWHIVILACKYAFLFFSCFSLLWLSFNTVTDGGQGIIIIAGCRNGAMVRGTVNDLTTSSS